MKSLNNEDKQIIKMLKQMPKAHDTRDKNELFHRISSQIDKVEQPKKKKKFALIPIFSTVLVFAILLIIIPSVMDNNGLQTQEDKQYSNNAADSSASEESLEKSNESGGMDNQGDAAIYDDSNTGSVMMDKSQGFAVKASDGRTVIHAAATDQQGQYVIPLSFVVSKTDDLASYYNRLEDFFNETEWGVGEYLFEDVSFTIDTESQQVTMNFPEGFSMGQGSTNATMFEDILTTMFGPQQIEKVVFETPNDEGIDLGPFGIIKELKIESLEKASYKLYQASEETREFLVPIPQENQIEIDAALNEMKQDQAMFNVSRSIPNDLEFSVETASNQLSFIFSEGNSFMNSKMSVKEKITTIEAVLMTSKSFGFDSVEFINADIEQIGPYNLTEPIKVPRAANPINVNP